MDPNVFFSPFFCTVCVVEVGDSFGVLDVLSCLWMRICNLKVRLPRWPSSSVEGIIVKFTFWKTSCWGLFPLIKSHHPKMICRI